MRFRAKAKAEYEASSEAEHLPDGSKQDMNGIGKRRARERRRKRPHLDSSKNLSDEDKEIGEPAAKMLVRDADDEHPETGSETERSDSLIERLEKNGQPNAGFERDEEMHAGAAAALRDLFTVAYYTTPTAEGKKMYDKDGNEKTRPDRVFPKEEATYRLNKSNSILVMQPRSEHPCLNMFYDNSSLATRQVFCLRFCAGAQGIPIEVKPNVTYVCLCEEGKMHSFITQNRKKHITLAIRDGKWNLVDDNSRVVVAGLDVLGGQTMLNRTEKPKDLSGATALSGVEMTTIDNFECGNLDTANCGSGSAKLVSAKECLMIDTKAPGASTMMLRYPRDTLANLVYVSWSGLASDKATLASCWSIQDNKPYAMRLASSLKKFPLKVAKNRLYAIENTKAKVSFFRPTDDLQHVMLVNDGAKWNIKVATKNGEKWETGATLVENVQMALTTSRNEMNSTRKTMQLNLPEDVLRMESTQVADSFFKVGKFDYKLRAKEDTFVAPTYHATEAIEIQKTNDQYIKAQVAFRRLGSKRLISVAVRDNGTSAEQNTMYPFYDSKCHPWLMCFTPAANEAPLRVLPNHRYAICCGDYGKDHQPYFFETTAQEQYIKLVKEGDQYVLKGASERNAKDWKTLIQNVCVSSHK